MFKKGVLYLLLFVGKIAWGADFRVEGYLLASELQPQRELGTSTPMDLYPYTPWPYADQSLSLVNASDARLSTSAARRSPKETIYPALRSPRSLALYYGDSHPEWTWNGAVTDFHLLAVSLDREGKLDLSRLNNSQLTRFQSFTHLAEARSHLVLSGDSSQFKAALRLSVSRQRLTKDLLEFAVENGFTGITIDWKFPRDGEEKKLLVTWVRELTKEMSPRKMVLTVAISPYDRYPATLYELVSALHLISYEFTGRHSTFEHVLWSLDRLIDGLKVPASKVILGLPFYGKIFSSEEDSFSSKKILYRDLVKEGFPLSSSQNEKGNVYFNGPDLIQEKVRYARKRKVGGVVAWRLGADTTGPLSLLKAISASADF